MGKNINKSVAENSKKGYTKFSGKSHVDPYGYYTVKYEDGTESPWAFDSMKDAIDYLNDEGTRP